MSDAADGAADHSADEQAWTKDTARISGGVRRGRRDYFQNDQERHELESHFSVQGIADVYVTDPKHFGYAPAEDSHNYPADRRPQPFSRLRKCEKAAAHP